jgi:hypothetical protein
MSNPDKVIIAQCLTVPKSCIYYYIIIKTKVLPLRMTLADTILFRPFSCLVPKDFKIVWLSNILSMSVCDESYSRKEF